MQVIYKFDLHRISIHQIAKTLWSTLIKHQSNTFASDQTLIDVDPQIFAIWDCTPLSQRIMCIPYSSSCSYHVPPLSIWQRFWPYCNLNMALPWPVSIGGFLLHFMRTVQTNFLSFHLLMLMMPYEGNYTGNYQDTHLCIEFENYTSKNTATSNKGKMSYNNCILTDWKYKTLTIQKLAIYMSNIFY